MARLSPHLDVDTPFGPLRIVEDDGAISAITWRGGRRSPARDEGEATPLLREAARQLHAYGGGDLTVFDLPLRPKGGPLQQDVMREMRAIPFGETRSYGDIAKALGVGAQSIGQACGANPIPVIIPCHRVTGTHGIGGFSGMGGVDMKVALLRHEGAYGLLI